MRRLIPKSGTHRIPDGGWRRYRLCCLHFGDERQQRRRDMSGGRTLYWLLTGACLGFGAIRFRGKSLWAALVGFGGAPALLLIWDVVSGPWGCITPGGGDSQPGVRYYTCVETPVGQLTSYHVMAFGFGVIA